MTYLHIAAYLVALGGLALALGHESAEFIASSLHRNRRDAILHAWMVVGCLYAVRLLLVHGPL